MRARAEAPAPLALTNQAVLATVMAAAPTEAFVSEFAEYAPSAYSTALGWDAVPAAISDCAQVLQQLEREPVTTKYFEASKALNGKAFNKGSSRFQDFKLLIDLRNGIMHIKPTTERDRPLGERVTAATTRARRTAEQCGPVGAE